MARSPRERHHLGGWISISNSRTPWNISRGPIPTKGIVTLSLTRLSGGGQDAGQETDCHLIRAKRVRRESNGKMQNNGLPSLHVTMWLDRDINMRLQNLRYYYFLLIKQYNREPQTGTPQLCQRECWRGNHVLYNYMHSVCTYIHLQSPSECPFSLRQRVKGFRCAFRIRLLLRSTEYIFHTYNQISYQLLLCTYVPLSKWLLLFEPWRRKQLGILLTTHYRWIKALRWLKTAGRLIAWCSYYVWRSHSLTRRNRLLIVVAYLPYPVQVSTLQDGEVEALPLSKTGTLLLTYTNRYLCMIVQSSRPSINNNVCIVCTSTHDPKIN